MKDIPPALDLKPEAVGVSDELREQACGLDATTYRTADWTAAR